MENKTIRAVLIIMLPIAVFLYAIVNIVFPTIEVEDKTNYQEGWEVGHYRSIFHYEEQVLLFNEGIDSLYSLGYTDIRYDIDIDMYDWEQELRSSIEVEKYPYNAGFSAFDKRGNIVRGKFVAKADGGMHDYRYGIIWYGEKYPKCDTVNGYQAIDYGS